MCQFNLVRFTAFNFETISTLSYRAEYKYDSIQKQLESAQLIVSIYSELTNAKANNKSKAMWIDTNERDKTREQLKCIWSHLVPV
jgi:hypothetical protein